MNPGHPGQPRQPDRPQFIVTLQPADDAAPDAELLTTMLAELGWQIHDLAVDPQVVVVSPVDAVRDK